METNWMEIWPLETETGSAASTAWKSAPARAKMSKLGRTVWPLMRTWKRRWPVWEKEFSVELEIDGVAAVGDGEQVGEGSAGERAEVGGLVEGRGGGAGDGSGLEVGPPPVKLESGFQRMPEGSVKGEALPASIRMGVKTGAAVMEKVKGAVVPAEVVTVTLKLPRVALAAMVKVAVI